MHHLFTAKWPAFARLEAALFFAALLLICNKSPAARAVLADLASAEAIRTEIPAPVLAWGALAFLAAGPYLGLLLAADRLLGLRHGCAWLSAAVVGLWAGTAAILAPDVATLLPPAWIKPSAKLPITLQGAILAASAALLLHARPLWIGLHDRGLATIRTSGQSVPNPWNVAGPGQPGNQPTRDATFLVPAIGLGLVFVILAATWFDRSKPAPANLSLDATPRHLPRIVSPGGEGRAWRRMDGSFGVQAIVNDHPMTMTFDTGATLVALTAEDAGRLGMTARSLAFTLKVHTANGTASVAPVMIDTLQVGSITMTNVRAVVAQPGALHESLLGQSFLARLKDYRVESNSVIFHAQ